MHNFFQTILTTSFHGSIVILAVLALRLILRKAPKKFICWLWMLAGLRLLMPIPLQSHFSLQPQSIPIPVSVSLARVLPIVWAVVAAIIGSYSFLSYLHLRRKVDDAVKIPGGWESDRIETAFVLGFVKPKIYIPIGMSGQTKAQILAHERTHLDKGDHWIKMIGFLALCLHWFNPLVWLSYVLLCKDIEMACDERVVQFMELEERKAYSSALLQCSTNHPHYAACPVAFGEVSVKYRIKSVLNYRKPSFWLSLLAIVAIGFVAVCLMTSPETVVEVPVDPDAPLQEISREDPADFTPAVLPEMEPNPDWGIRVMVDAATNTGGQLVYEIQERFAAASSGMTMKDSYLERWDGLGWEPVPSLSGDTKAFPDWQIGFAAHRSSRLEYLPEDMDWSLNYGALPAGDYCIVQTIESEIGEAVFRAPFHIYREALPSEQEAALARCEKALSALHTDKSYGILLSETDQDGNLSPIKAIGKANGQWKIEYYLGQFTTSTAQVTEAWNHENWDEPFRLDRNRKILFPEGQSLISAREISFWSVWTDYRGISHRGRDIFSFQEDGSLQSVDRLIQTLDEKGNVAEENTIRLDAEVPDVFYGSESNLYEYENSFDAQDKSPWKIFFRVDDDLLSPSAGEIWLGVNAIGVSNYTTDGKYWLEKKESVNYGAKEWVRLGGEEKESDWGGGTIQLTSNTTVLNVDWTKDYGRLDAGVYRMGKHFYKGDESIIQYAEFAIYQTGGIFGEGGEEAVARCDAAMDKLRSGNYRVECYVSGRSPYSQGEELDQVIWKYGDAECYDFHNKAGQYSHSSVEHPEDSFHMNWWKREQFPSEYDCLYFADGRSVISDREIQFVKVYSRDSADDFNVYFTYRFDENGDLTEFIRSYSGAFWKGDTLRYVVTDTPESEIQAWVEAKEIEQREYLKTANPGS